MVERTFCRICEASCGLTVHEVDGQLKVKPDRDHPVSGGFVCAKGTRFAEVAFDPRRITEPMRRRANGELEAVSWERAIDEAGARLHAILDAHGPHSVALYIGNPLAFHAMGQLGATLFALALKSRNVFSAGSVDCNNKFAGAQVLHGSPVIHPIPDFEHADLAVLFGTNPLVSQASFVHLKGGATVFDDMTRRGARVMFVDVRRTESARRWGDLLRVRAGTDIALILTLLDHFAKGRSFEDPRLEGLDTLLALAREMPFARASEITGVSLAEIEALRDAINLAEHTAFHMSVGVNQGPFGTLSYVALQALMFVTGNYDTRGGSLFSSIAVQIARASRRAGLFTRKDRSRVGDFPTVLDTLPSGVLSEEILREGRDQIRALIVIAGDPVRSIPGSRALATALASLDTLISIDMFENATARHADYLLPATSWLERPDLALPGLPLQTSDLWQATRAVIPPVGDTRPEHEILAALALAMDRPFLSSRAATRLIARPRLLTQGLDLALRIASLRSRFGEYGFPVDVPSPGSYLGRGPLNEGHRVRFWHPDLDAERARLGTWLAERPRAEPGFVLLGRRRRIGHNSWLHGGARTDEGASVAWLASEDVEKLGLTRGGKVRLRTHLAEIVVEVRVDEGVAPGTVVLAHGELDANANELIGTDQIEPISGQLTMTGTPIELEAVAELQASAPLRA